MWGSFTGVWWSFVFGVRCLWRHNLTSYSCFQAKFVDRIGLFFFTHSPYFCKNQALYTRLIIKFCKILSSRKVVWPQPSPFAYALGINWILWFAWCGPELSIREVQKAYVHNGVDQIYWRNLVWSKMFKPSGNLVASVSRSLFFSILECQAPSPRTNAKPLLKTSWTFCIWKPLIKSDVRKLRSAANFLRPSCAQCTLLGCFVPVENHWLMTSRFYAKTCRMIVECTETQRL